MQLNLHNENRDCVYFTVCLNRTDCGKDCIRYAEISYLLSHSNLPKIQQKKHELIGRSEDMDAFMELQRIKENILSFVNEGKSLYIFSANTGNGKTSWACKLLKSYFNEIWSGNGFKTKGYFLHLNTYLNDCKKQIDYPNEAFEELKTTVYNVPLLVIDDIGSTPLSIYEQNLFLNLVEYRCNNELATIYTANLKEDDLKRSVGSRIKSRIYNSSIRIELKGKDMRSP